VKEMVKTPNMNLNKPASTATLSDYYDSIDAILDRLDSHDHSAGKGVKLTPASINITSNLAFNDNAITEAKYLQYVNQDAHPTPTTATYFKDGFFYIRTPSGTNIQLTTATGFNGALVGGIGGDYSTSGAILEYDSLSEAYSFFRETNFYASIKTGDITIYETDEEGTTNGITFKAPDGLATSYDLVLPADAPATSDSVMVVNTSGVASFLPNTTPPADTGNRILKFSEVGNASVSAISFNDFPTNAGDAYKIIQYNSDGILSVSSTEPLLIPSGGNDDRPITPSQFMFRGNTDSGEFEAYINGTWKVIPAFSAAGIAFDDLVDVNISSPSNKQALVYNEDAGVWENGSASLEKITSPSDNLTAEENKFYLLTSVEPRVVTLPEAPTSGTEISIKDLSYSASTSFISVEASGDDEFEDGSITLEVNGDGMSVDLLYINNKWVLK